MRQNVQVSKPVGTRATHRALVPVAPHVGDDSILVEAPERVVPGELAARPRERRVALLRRASSPDSTPRRPPTPARRPSWRCLWRSCCFCTRQFSQKPAVAGRYSRQSESEDDAASAVETARPRMVLLHKGAPVAEKREAAKLIMEGFMQAYDDKAAKFAPQGYEPPRTAERREAAKVASRRLNPHPRIRPTHITNGFFSWRLAMPVSCNAARRRRTSQQKESRAALLSTTAAASWR